MKSVRIMVVEEPGDISDLLAALPLLGSMTKTITSKPPVMEKILERLTGVEAHYDAVIINCDDRPTAKEIAAAMREAFPQQLIIIIRWATLVDAWHAMRMIDAIRIIKRELKT